MKYQSLLPFILACGATLAFAAPPQPEPLGYSSTQTWSCWGPAAK